MIPRLIRKGLIECPKCKWKQDITNDFCPMCNFKFTKQKGSNINVYLDNRILSESQKKDIEFDLNKIEINTPSNYISMQDKSHLRSNKNKFFELIVDADKYDPKDLINNFYKIIGKANSKFIENEKSIMRSLIRNDLNEHEGFFTDSDKINFKKKYDKGYYDYYTHFNVETSIFNKNSKFIEQEKKNMQIEFDNELNSHKGVISDSDKQKLKEKYDKSYYNYYENLGFDKLIDEFNTGIITIEAYKFVSNYKNGYISQSEKIALEKNFMHDFNLDEIVNEHNQKYIENSQLDVENQISDLNIEKDDNSLNEIEDEDVRCLIGDFKEYVSKPFFKMSIRKFKLSNDEIEYVKKIIINDIIEKRISGQNIDFKIIINEYCNKFVDEKRDILSDEDLEILLNEVNVTDYDVNIVDECKLKTINDYKSNKINQDSVKLKFTYYLNRKVREKDQLFTLEEIIQSPDIPGIKRYLTISERTEIYNFTRSEICSEFGLNKSVLETIKFKMNRKLERNKSEARERLTSFRYDRKYFMEITGVSVYQIEPFIKEIENLIDINKIKTDDINEMYLGELGLMYIDYGRIIL